VRTRTATALGVLAFLAWNAIFDHVLVVAGDLLVAVMPVLSAHGARLQMAEWMTIAKTIALWSASVITGAGLVGAGLLAALVRIRRG
jgi:hypothetical protein